MIERSHDVVIVGAGAAEALREGGLTDFVVLDRDVISSVVDDATDTWRLTTRDGETSHGRVVITCESPFVRWIPDILGRNDFRGESFHAAARDLDFDPSGKRVAVIGSDSTAGALIEQLATSAASVEVFPYPPRRAILATRPKRWLRRRTSAELVTSPIDTVTASGIRTCDGAHHDTDAIIYGTGFAIPAELSDDALVGAGGLTIRQAWHDGMEPYLGVAVHGFPNYFFIAGPEAQAHYVVECLQLMKGHTRIEVRRSNQQVFNERVHLRRPSARLVASAFDLSSPVGVHDDIYDGAATLTVADSCRQVRVRLTGHVDPIDGKYHWQGTVFDQLSAELLKQARTVTLTVGERSASARITEETPQGTHSIAGVGAPPFEPAAVERISTHK